MNTIHEKALSNAIKLLNAIGAKYAIVDSDNKIHGELEVKAKAKVKRKPAKYTYGVIRKHIRPYLDHIKANDTARIPVSPYDLKTVYGSASSTATVLWGKQCHKVGVSDDKRFVLITRTEPMDDMDDLFAQLGIK
jgi:hypothetical protein